MKRFVDDLDVDNDVLIKLIEVKFIDKYLKLLMQNEFHLFLI